MGAGAMHSQSHNTNDTQPARSTRKVNNMSCEVCDIHLNFFKRKKTCSECGKLHCANCLSKSTSSGGAGRHRCRLCWYLVSDSLSRSDLMAYGSRDLRRFLVKRHVPVDKCTEKRDLVELILQLRNGQTNPHYQQQLEHEQHLLRLQENVRDSDQTTRSSATSHSQPPSQQPSDADVIIIEDLEESEDQPVARAEALVAGSQQQSVSASSCSTALKAEMNDGHDSTAKPITQDIPKKSRPSRLTSMGEESIDSLSIRQLKEILVKNFVNYKGCCEKWELVDRVRRLWAENKHNQQQAKKIENDAAGGTITSGSGGATTSDLCKVCMDAVIDCVLLDCGHMVTCTNCGKRMAECPICRQYVVRVVHTFKA